MTDIPKESKSHKLRTGIIVTLATILTSVSLAMITVSSWERSGTLLEAVLLSLLSGSVALSAHLLPALVKRRVGKFGGSLVMVIWAVAVLITLYSHTVFFITNMTQSGENRADNSAQVQDISKMATETEDLAKGSNARSKVDITRDIANNNIQLQNYLARRCRNPSSTQRCRALEGGIASLQAKESALNVELQEADRVEALKEKAMNMQMQAMDVKDSKRLDPVTEKISKIFNGVNVNAITLGISVVNAALLEMLASLFWWLVWPGKTEKEPVKDAKFESKMNRKSQSLKTRTESSEPTVSLVEESKAEPIETLALNKNVMKEELPFIKEGKIVYNQGYVDRTEEDLFISQFVKRIIMSIPETYIQRNKGSVSTEDLAILSYINKINIISVPVEREKKTVEEMYNEIENKEVKQQEAIQEVAEVEEPVNELNQPLFEKDENVSTQLFSLEPEEPEKESLEVEAEEIIPQVVSINENKVDSLDVSRFILKMDLEKAEEIKTNDDNIEDQDHEEEKKVVNSRFPHLKDKSLLVNSSIKPAVNVEKKTIVRSISTNTDKLPMEDSIGKINSAFNRKVIEESKMTERLVVDNDDGEVVKNNKKENNIKLRTWGKFAEEKENEELPKMTATKDDEPDDIKDIMNMFNN